MQNTLPQPVQVDAKESPPLADSLSKSTTSTPPSPGFAEFAKKVNQLAEALKPQGNHYYQVGNYEIMGEIGHGGQGVVFYARDKLLKREVALKVPHLRFMSEPLLSERFLREARSLALLDHPNIVRIYEIGEIQSLPYLVFDYCRDGNLTDWLKAYGPKVAPRTAAAWIGQLAEGLHHAHQRNILHRDIKPNNIFIQRRETEAASDELGLTLKLGDFGLAKIVDATLSEQHITLPQDRLGTPAYMAPEQLEGQNERVCPATDVYSMGVMLYELLMGKPLYPLANSLATRRLHLSGEPPNIRKEQPSIPRDLEAICCKCLEHDPAQRYRDGGALATDIRNYLDGGPIRRPRFLWRSLQRSFKRYRTTIVTLVCLAILGIGYVAWGRVPAETPLVSQITGLPLAKGDCKEVWAICFSPDGKLMYFAGDSEAKNPESPVIEHVTTYDMEAHRVVMTFPTHAAMIRDMAVVDKGRTLITCSYDGTVREWDTVSGEQKHQSPLIQLPLVIHAGKKEDRQIRVMAISRDEKWVAVANKAYSSGSATVMAVNRETGQEHLLSLTMNPQQIVFPEKKNNAELLIVSDDCQKVLRWRLIDSTAVSIWEFQNKIESSTFTLDGHQLVLATDTHRFKHFLWPSRHELPEMEGHDCEVRKMVFSADAQWMVSLDIRGTVILWDLRRDTIGERKQYPLKRSVEGLAFSPDGKWLAVGDYNGCVELIPIPNNAHK
ncbi:MAG: serine/threonine-protein kinase [Gemmatales bacterium]